MIRTKKNLDQKSSAINQPYPLKQNQTLHHFQIRPVMGVAQGEILAYEVMESCQRLQLLEQIMVTQNIGVSLDNAVERARWKKIEALATNFQGRIARLTRTLVMYGNQRYPL